jgi:hypothetical protein
MQNMIEPYIDYEIKLHLKFALALPISLSIIVGFMFWQDVVQLDGVQILAAPN